MLASSWRFYVATIRSIWQAPWQSLGLAPQTTHLLYYYGVLHPLLWRFFTKYKHYTKKDGKSYGRNPNWERKLDRAGPKRVRTQSADTVVPDQEGVRGRGHDLESTNSRRYAPVAASHRAPLEIHGVRAGQSRRNRRGAATFMIWKRICRRRVCFSVARRGRSDVDQGWRCESSER
jgi:hypothetical protein